MTVLEIGPGMGFFSIPMARLVGENGRVVAVDIQEKMLRALERRATKSGVRERIGTRLCDTGSFGISDLAGQVDFALLFAVVHEVPDPERLWREVAGTLKKGALVLFSEPKRPVSEEEFRKSVDQSELSGLRIVRYPRIWKSRSVLLQMI
jgi:2-polyprenyl-3-methyl-5-hydroxy-6-metoxy-1,4-benzoquinol methylase